MNWQGCKNILCIRPDNMGDLIMSVPAIRALKETFGAKITVLTSSMAKGIVEHIPEIDEAIIFDLPWVKTQQEVDRDSISDIIEIIKSKEFDAAVIFTVYSQSPMPTAMLAYLAAIPKVLAYCRENPYQLINCWVPDQEPYDLIKHQVRRDLDLVQHVGASTKNESLSIQSNERLWQSVIEKLTAVGVDSAKPWILLHAGVSEKKREYPVECWLEAAKLLIGQGYQIILTGSASEKQLTDQLELKIGQGAFSAGGQFVIDEFICLVKHAPVLVSVNTGTIHIAAAVGTPVVVLYAQTNPQHTPWGVPNKVLEFQVPAHARSKNEVIKYVNETHYSRPAGFPTAADVVTAVNELISLPGSPTPPFRETPNESPEIAAS
jgi:lipopolysaccharide heptosyltransferase II